MTDLFRIGVAVVVLMVAVPRDGLAQIPGFSTSVSWTAERLSENHWKLTGAVELSREDMKFYADEVDYYADTNRLTASGNVVFTQSDLRISAERAEFDTRTRLGTFYGASAIARLPPQSDLALFGTLEPDVYFYGETLERIGPDRYRITRGGFTTCVQPTPRWEMTSSSVVLRLDHYAVMRNTLLKVKRVPVFYLPVLYYPIKKDDRATGFLLPQYGASSMRGQTISNAFFWALGRSHDVEFLHDWYSKTGQGFGTEYRYALGQGSGNARTYFLREHETTYLVGDVEQVSPARKSFQIAGSANQTLNPHLTARGRADYFSNITVQQTYNTDILQLSTNRRLISGALTGTWGIYTVNGSYDRTEYFSNATTSTLTGGTPRITATRAERRLARTPLYASVSGEFQHILRKERYGEAEPISRGLNRMDVTPVLRFPFTRWQFLTVNSSLAWRNTFWSDSVDLDAIRSDAGIARRYFDMQAQVTGPTFNRIWDTPGNGYAERFKHSIQPSFTVRRITTIDNNDQIVKLDAVDYVVGKVTLYSYGVTNRFYAKRRQGGSAATALEIASVSLQQTYYTDANLAKYDVAYRTSYGDAPSSKFSPVSLVVRATPLARVSGAFRAEYDGRHHAFRTIGADATVARGDWLQATLGWSQKRYVEELAGYNDRSRLDHYINSATTLRLQQNRYGFVYSFNYDMLRDALLQQRFAGYYNAQCCGVAAEYQMRDLTSFGTTVAVPKDSRISFSFTLAGVGTFTNFFGALGAVGR